MANKKIMTADFITRLADKGYTKKDSAVIVADFLAVIYDAIEHGEEVRLIGFGAFSAKETKQKEFVDVTTGKKTISAPHKKVCFKPGEALKRAAEAAP